MSVHKAVALRYRSVRFPLERAIMFHLCSYPAMLCASMGSGSTKLMKWLKNFWTEWNRVRGHWQELGGFFKVAAIRFFVSWFALVPVVANALSELPDQFQVKIASTSYSIIVSLPFTWELLWLSSLFFALAFAVYSFRCPSFIKLNPDFGTFSAKRHSNRWVAWELHYGWLGIDDREKLAKRLISKGYATATELVSSEAIDQPPKVEDRGTIWRFVHDGQVYEVCMSENDTDQRVGDIFWEIYGRWAGSRSFSRYVVWASLTASIGLFSFVVLQNIVAGLSLFYGA